MKNVFVLIDTFFLRGCSMDACFFFIKYGWVGGSCVGRGSTAFARATSSSFGKSAAGRQAGPSLYTALHLAQAHANAVRSGWVGEEERRRALVGEAGLAVAFSVSVFSHFFGPHGIITNSIQFTFFLRLQI